MQLLLNGITGPLGIFMSFIVLVLIYGITTGVRSWRSGTYASMRRPLIFTGAFSVVSILVWAILMTDTLGTVPAAHRYTALVYLTQNLCAVLAFSVCTGMVLYGVRILTRK